jgi:predicted alpha/beta superfamily hydrolase
MFDGQNVFDARTSFSGEWRVDEALEAGIPAGRVAPIIVVAVDNGGASRVDEYTPWVGTFNGQPGGGGGVEHLRVIAEVLKPWVDQNHRTLPGPESTGLAGSSLGGLMGVSAAYTRPDVFGRVAALSPSVWWSGERLVEFVTQQPKPAVRLWTDMGTAEGSIAPFRRLRAALLADGFVEGADLRTVEVAGAGHIEAAWAARMPDVLAYLFPPP